MLIIGDAAINRLDNNHAINKLEIISNEEHISYVKNCLGLVVGEKINKVTTRYYKTKKEILIHNADKNIELKNLLQITASERKIFKFIPPRLQYAIQRINVIYIYKNPNNWSHDINGYNILREHCTMELRNRSDMQQALAMFSTKVMPFTISNPNIKSLLPSDLVKGNINYYDLSKIFSKTNNPAYNYIWSESMYEVSDNKFLLLDYEKQIEACLERIYLETIVSYFENDDNKKKLNAYQIRTYFMKAYMDVCSRYFKHKFFSKFLVEEHINIMLSYDNSFYQRYKRYLSNKL